MAPWVGIWGSFLPGRAWVLKLAGIQVVEMVVGMRVPGQRANAMALLAVPSFASCAGLLTRDCVNEAGERLVSLLIYFRGYTSL